MNLKALTLSNARGFVLVLTLICTLVSCELDGGGRGGHSVANPMKMVDTGRPQGPTDTAVTGFHHTSAVAVKEPGSICGENWCSSLDESELLALDAIRSLHRQIDDDKNGNIDFDESDEFLREELMYEGDYEKRQRLLHQDDDNHVSVKELWDSWVRSEVHNWTTDQTIDWLSHFVGLPQYSKNFFDNSVNGSVLPRLAINHLQVLSTSVGIKDLIHRQKIALKAQDVVLFGSPKDFGNRTKDSVLTTLLVLALMVCWFVYSRYKVSQRDLNRMIVDMESLAKAEQGLMDLQKELEKARTAQQEKALEAGFQRNLLDDGVPGSEEITRLKGEVEVLRNELQRAEVELQDKCWVPPPALQHWLQLTYELELKSYNRKRQSAEKQLKQAKDACDKLKKKRSSLMGAFVSTHGRSIDDVDKAILEARTALTEITQELQERMHRWKQIELLINCPIMNNPGLPYLETILRGIGRGLQFNGPGSVISNSQDDIDDDGASSIYCPSAITKLVSTSTYLMYPGHDIPFRSFPPSSTSLLSNSDDMSSNGCAMRKISTPSPFLCNSIAVQPASCDPSSPNVPVSAPVSSGSGVHVPIMRSKSVSSMISLREKAVSSRECSSKDSSTGDDDVNMDMTTSEMTSARDRRVTFGIRTDHRELFSSVNQPRQLYKEEKQEMQAETGVEGAEASVEVEAAIEPKANKSSNSLQERNSSKIEIEEEIGLVAKASLPADMDIVGSLKIGVQSQDSSIPVEVGKKVKEQAKIWKILTKGFRHIHSQSNSGKLESPKKSVEEYDGRSVIKKRCRSSSLLTWSRHLLKPSLRLSVKDKHMLAPVTTINAPEKSG